MRTFIIPLLFILFLVPIAYADSVFDYNTTGRDGTYDLGGGSFNSNLETDTVRSGSVPDSKGVPLVSDLDGDGTNEIIALGSTAKIFQGTTLTQLFSLSLSNERTSAPVIFDIDGDGFSEILITQEASEDLLILEYNGTSFHIQSTLSYAGVSAITDSDTSIQCKAVNECVIAYTEGEFLSDFNVYASFFNSTEVDVSSEVTIFTATGPTTYNCFPKSRTMQVVNIDATGDEDYVFSSFHQDTGGDLDYEIHYVSTVGNNLTPTTLASDQDTDVTFPESTNQCASLATKISAPFVANIDDAVPSTDLEVIIGYVVDDDFQFNMRTFQHTGSVIETYPTTIGIDGEGSHVSNVVMGNFISDSADEEDREFCVLGYDDFDGDILDDNEIEMICARHTGDNKNIVYEASDIALFNMTSFVDALQPFSHLIHSVQMSSQVVGNENMDEILSPYGVLLLDNPSLGGNVIEFEFPFVTSTHFGGSAIAVDVLKEGIAEEIEGGANDLLLLTDTNLFYFNDGVNEEPAVITNWAFNPCPVDTTLELNSTMNVQVTVEDQNPSQFGFDQVTSSVIAYEGGTNEFTIDKDNRTTGSTFSFEVFLNKSVSGATLTLQGKDDRPLTTPDEIEFSFTVATVGLTQEDGVTCEQEVTTVALTPEQIAIQSFQSNNTLTQGADALGEIIFQTEANQTTRTVIFLIFMVLIALVIVSGESVFGLHRGASAMVCFSVLAFVEFIVLMIGFFTGFISFGVLLTIIVIALAILSLSLRRMFFESRT